MFSTFTFCTKMPLSYLVCLPIILIDYCRPNKYCNSLLPVKIKCLSIQFAMMQSMSKHLETIRIKTKTMFLGKFYSDGK